MNAKTKTEWSVPRGGWVTVDHAALILENTIESPVNWTYWLLEDRRGRGARRPHISFLRLANRRTMYDTADFADFTEAVERGEILFNRRRHGEAA
ncbi:hypothetical protein CKO42_13065 [Lamprobacter modestohalophilus]|uniref:Uncharacterized protein n=1 Tax=Lamprobacter modestohalophilus TaxID=1064514 RepID=A0A9X1B561_9GAMM|nr:hypothetical protein [Lamprobacter modestohalophilus]MBK1619352.1 hypothetical protein [Lamprobacter modestohalophilus]